MNFCIGRDRGLFLSGVLEEQNGLKQQFDLVDNYYHHYLRGRVRLSNPSLCGWDTTNNVGMYIYFS